MANRITEDPTPPPAPFLPPAEMLPDTEIPLLDDAIPLVRNEPWQWWAVFFDAPGWPTDISGKTPKAKLRWATGEAEVSAALVPGATGMVQLSLTAAATAGMPYGQLLRLFLAVDLDTEAVVPVTVLEGYSS